MISRSIRNTGANAACKSTHAANDMVGNLSEWVADWIPRRTCSANWGSFSDDSQGICGAATTGAPGALIRGGDFDNNAFAGTFAVAAGSAPLESASVTGFRRAR